MPSRTMRMALSGSGAFTAVLSARLMAPAAPRSRVSEWQVAHAPAKIAAPGWPSAASPTGLGVAQTLDQLVGHALPLGRGRPGDRCYEDRNGAHVVFRHSAKVVHDRRHRAGGGAMQWRAAAAQIGEKAVGRPRYRRRTLRIQGRRVPAFRAAAGKVLAPLLRAERIARRVAGAAMGNRVGQVGTASPRRVVAGL